MAKMLSIVLLRGALARVDYLFADALAPDERKGVWLGGGCSYLGGVAQGQIVEPEALFRVLAARDPASRFNLLAARPKPGIRRAGWDFTFSAHKSVSLAATPRSPVSKIVRGAWSAALRATYPVIESLLSPQHWQLPPPALCRSVAAHFTHLTNRWREPHLHHHLIVMNCAACQEDETRWRWRSVSEKKAMLASVDVDRLLQADFAERLAKAGLRVDLDREGIAMLPEIPDEACRALSSGLDAANEFYEARKVPPAKRRARGPRAKLAISGLIRPPKPEKFDPDHDPLGTLPDDLRGRLNASWTGIAAGRIGRGRHARASLPPPPPTPAQVEAVAKQVIGASSATLAILYASRSHAARITRRLVAAGCSPKLSFAAVRRWLRDANARRKALYRSLGLGMASKNARRLGEARAMRSRVARGATPMPIREI